MRHLFGLLAWVATLLMLAVPAASAADRSMTLLPGTDLPGFDYSVIRNTDADQCSAACLDDNVCRAFTFNEEAGWCFLKGGSGPQKPFATAVSGIVKSVPTPEALAATRASELPFPAADLIAQAQDFAAALPDTDPPPQNSTYADLVATGDDAVANDNPDGAMVSYRQALGINGNDAALWLKLAEAGLASAERAIEQDEDSYDQALMATYAATNSFLMSEAVPRRAAALAALAHALELREVYRESIATYRASMALVADADVEKRLDKVVAEHGFRVVSNDVDSEAASPSICAMFSDPLPNEDLASYVVVEDTRQAAVETQHSQICITGIEHGQRYHIKLRAGLPSADGEKLRKDVELDVYVPDRSPFVGFANNAYVMPSGLGGGLPISSVNAETADAAIYRIGDRAIAATVRNGIFQQTLTTDSAESIANQSGEKVWEGQVDLARGKPNEMAVTAIPVGDVLPDLKPGAYVITAKVTGAEADYWDDIATQWFIVTDIGLTTVSGEDGVHAFVRSLTSAGPIANAHVRLVAVNNEILGEAVTDAGGRADFAPGLARGDGGRAPQLLVAETDAGDYAFLDVSKPGFDLTDRGVEGRPAANPLDVFATTERGVYRPGETVFLTALMRDNHAKAVTDLPLTMEAQRPDGVIAFHEVLNDRGAGSYFKAMPLAGEAMRGSWHIKLYADPKAPPLANVNFLVEDFEPERLAFEVSADKGPVAVGEVMPIEVSAKYLYGATAPDLDIEADAVLRPTSTLAGYPGYRFGRLDDTFEPDRTSLGVVGTTDEAGKATAEITIQEVRTTTRPLMADIILRLIDTTGRPVERSLTRPVLADGDRIGIKAAFDEAKGLEEGSEARFDIIAVAPTGETVDKPGLKWTLSRIETNYQWYRTGGTWKWEAITTARHVADGMVDAEADGPVTVAAPVDWGRYRIEVESTGDNPTSSSYEFYAGYYYSEAGSNTPDTLQVALDKPVYRAGETANLKLDPQFAGTALIMVVDDRIIDMQAVEVPEGGLSVPLKVTEDWGPGAYVTAILYRPASAPEKRMPARALGLAYADVDPGDMKLDVGLQAPKEALPRQAFTTRVRLGNVEPGETAYVAIAAVDLGILNLTNFKVPDPDGWYFGQRQLGVTFRDLYGQLIDPTQGMPGALRSGGDSGAARLGTPPATSVLVALHSDIVAVDADGTATISFTMPDFNGTVRLMAMAWTANAVGHASADVVVHDPVVVNLSPPRFLRLGDKSRLLVEIDNVSGPAGAYQVELAAADGLATDTPRQSVTLAAGARTALDLPLAATGIGDHKLTVTVTDPTGKAQTKELTLGVRATSAPQTTSEIIGIGPGESVTLDAARFTGIVPHTGTLTLAIGPIARLNVPELLLALDRYPYGCAEQVSSRALPLLYLNEVAEMIGMGDDDALKQRIKDAIADLLSKQTSSGGFGLWGPLSSTDLWIDAYVTDFLLRATAEGYEIRDEAMTMALDNLSNQVSYASDFSDGGEGLAYALYDLARGGRAAIGDLRYYMEAKLGDFGSPLAKAQIGAALALYGDNARAATAFAAAVEGLEIKDDPKSYRDDYGSQLRDTAAVLALAGEFKPAGIDVAALAGRLADLRDAARYTSTQEDAWTLMAAAALGRQTASGKVTIDGEALTGPVYKRYDQEHFDGASITIANKGNQKTEMKVSVTGIPTEPPPAASQGFEIFRSYYLPNGTEFDPTAEPIHQNDRFIVVLSLLVDNLGSGQYVVADPLPAGFEIENPDLTIGGVGDFSWLSLSAPEHVEARTDQYVAAFQYDSATPTLTTAFVVRAVSPGKFVLPGASVEDMYRPEFRGNTDAGEIEIGATGR